MIYYSSHKFSLNCLLHKRHLSTDMDDVLFKVINNVGIITLNRPKALNALNTSMVDKIILKLKEYECQVQMVIVQGTGDKLFSVGGDVKTITENGINNISLKLGSSYFKMSNLMNSLIGSYKIPYISLIDGITMGKGIELSVNGKYRVATENTLFATPETSIGIGISNSYILSRLEKNLGVMLGLTGHRLKGTDLVKTGIATHYVHSSKIKSLKSKLIEDNRDPEIILKENTDNLDDVKFTLEPFLEKIDTIFANERVEMILNALEKDNSEWAQGILKTLKEVSPTALKITRKQITNGKHLSLDECLKMEYRQAIRCIEAKYSADFYEGVRALLIDKDKKPKWSPSSLEEVKDEIIVNYLELLPNDKELQFYQF